MAPPQFSTLPAELFLMIIDLLFASTRRKSDIVQLRLVCRIWNQVMRTRLCKTVSMDYLLTQRYVDLAEKADGSFDSWWTSLGNIGNICENVHLDFRVLRNEWEVKLLASVERYTGLKLKNKLDGLKPHHLAQYEGDGGVNAMLLASMVGEVLDRCPNAHRLRIDFPALSIHYDEDSFTSTSVLANCISELFDRVQRRQHAISRREGGMAFKLQDITPEIDTLLLIGLSVPSLVRMWDNHIDLINLRLAMEQVKHLKTTLSLRNSYRSRPWSLFSLASNLETLAISQDFASIIDAPVHEHHDIHPIMSFVSNILPSPTEVFTSLTSLELADINISGDFFRGVGITMGETLRELRLYNVCMNVTLDGSTFHELSADSYPELWVGFPGIPLPETSSWAAIEINQQCTQLNVCCASQLKYNYKFRNLEVPNSDLIKFDTEVGQSSNRSLEQMFADVALGLEPPEGTGAENVPVFLPRVDEDGDDNIHPLLTATKPRAENDERMREYQQLIQSTDQPYPDRWLVDALDGQFVNSGSRTEKVIADISDFVGGARDVPGVFNSRSRIVESYPPCICSLHKAREGEMVRVRFRDDDSESAYEYESWYGEDAPMGD